MTALDTTPAAAAVQEAALRNLGPVRRLEVALELSDFARALAEAGMRRRHPEYTDQQIVEALVKELYGLREGRIEPEAPRADGDDLPTS